MTARTPSSPRRIPPAMPSRCQGRIAALATKRFVSAFSARLLSRFSDNLIECIGTARPPFRNDASGDALVENNQLLNVSDTARYANKPNGRPTEREKPLKFQCGVNREMNVDGWRTNMKGPNQAAPDSRLV